ncbi:acyl transferase/acyl hydrolase/lysophospholipase [Trichophaea hybrida]|nr:acyl transferase/acyl hydrolase/lysophospholipase [Trichophaea hybrida]
MSTPPQEPGLRLLSLDGGGIRGVSELVILHELMSRLQDKLNLSELPRPYQYFDIIGGTSTGGLIAIMLGRLRMSTDEALTEYNQLVGYVFGERKWAFQDGHFKATRLEEAIKKIVEKYSLDGDTEEMLDSRDDSVCKSFVCAVAAQNIGSPTLFRSYHVAGGINCQIWQAARATSAAPTFFKRIKIGGQHAEIEYIDGGIGFNNPVQQVLDEAHTIHENRPVDCILSVGTGRALTVGLPQPDTFQKLLPTYIITVLKRLATDSERTSREVEKRYRSTPGVYFRFNVEQGLQNITLEEWKKIGEVTTHTIQYLQEVKVSQEVDNLVNILAGMSGARSSSTTVAASTTPTSPRQAGILKHFTVPYCLSSAFTGREDILRLLERRFFAPQDELSRRIFVLYGLGGSGKTQICLKFCEKFKSRFWGVFWIDATSEETAEQSFRIIAESLKIEKTLDTIKQHLAISQNQWLLIFDNADDPEIDISKHFPLGGNILITSRNPNCSEYASGNDMHFEVDRMEPEDAITLLLKVARTDASDDARVDAEHLVHDLGFLALAINQAGSYITTRKCALNEYRERFQNRRDRSQLLRERLSKQRSSSYQSTVYTTWEISIKMVQETNPLALEILQLFSYLHYAQIPREIFKRASDRIYHTRDDTNDVQWTVSRVSEGIYNLLCVRKGENSEDWDEDVFERAIDTLQSFSLVKRERSKDQAIYTLHPLVSLWTREKLPDAEQLPFQQAIVCILNRSIGATFGNSEIDHQFRRQLFVHVEACREHFPEYFVCNQVIEQNVLHEMSNFAKTCTEIGSWKKAEELFVQVMETSSRVLGQEHPDTLISMANLASTYRNQGRWKEAEELEVQVMETRKRVLGQEHPDTLTTCIIWRIRISQKAISIRPSH